MSPKLKQVFLPTAGEPTDRLAKHPRAFVCSGELSRCIKAFIHAVTEGEPYIVVDRPNETDVDRAPFVAIGEAYGYLIHRE